MIFTISPKNLLTLAHDESKLDSEHYITLQLYFISKILEQYLPTSKRTSQRLDLLSKVFFSYGASAQIT